MDMQCPNCGDQLVYYRTDRQSTGNREALLQWCICPGCRHVALQRWSLGGAESTAGRGGSSGQYR